MFINPSADSCSLCNILNVYLIIFVSKYFKVGTAWLNSMRANIKETWSLQVRPIPRTGDHRSWSWRSWPRTWCPNTRSSSHLPHSSRPARVSPWLSLSSRESIRWGSDWVCDILLRVLYCISPCNKEQEILFNCWYTRLYFIHHFFFIAPTEELWRVSCRQTESPTCYEWGTS